MTTKLQIVIDCADPHAQARFWAAATHMEVEDHHDIVMQVVEAGHASLEEHTVEIDGRRAWDGMAACHDPEGHRPRLLFQQVPEPKTVKDRIHLDLHVGSDQRDTEVARLQELGASYLSEHSQGPFSWVTLADPEGNEFCVG